MVAFPLIFANCQKPDFKDFNAPVDKVISPNVIFHRTSGSTVTVTDKEGMGLVYGNITGYQLVDAESDYLVVAFEPFSSDANSGHKEDVRLARIDLPSGRVTFIDDPHESMLSSLRNIDSIFE